jgi:hypothetical protein
MTAGGVDLETFRREGRLTVAKAASEGTLHALAKELDAVLDDDRPGRRITAPGPVLLSLIETGGVLRDIASALLGQLARPLRALVFDKSPRCNWSVPWHQDRTIAVKTPRATPGYGPWSIKDGVHHVEPPFEVLAAMATLRLHLDPCGPASGPLIVAAGSHTLGRVPASRASAEARARPSLACLADAGDVLALATPILHCSPRAEAPGRRRVLHVDFAACDLAGGLQWLDV